MSLICRPVVVEGPRSDMEKDRTHDGTTRRRRGFGMTNWQGRALLTAGLDYGAKGYAHYPVTIEITDKGKKRPTFHVSWGEESSTDPGETWAWFGPGAPYENAGLGIDCHRSGIAVVDLDGQVGIDGWARLCAEHGEVPAPWQRTRSGGRHYFYRQRPDAPIYNTAGKVAPGIDVRGARDPESGRKAGGTVFVAPTRVQGVDGQVYQWMTPLPPVDQLPLAPEWLPALARKKSQERREEQAGRRMVMPGRSSAPRTADGTPVAPSTGLVLEGFQGAPQGLREYVERKLQEIRDLPVNGPGESPVNDIAFELSHYVPHQLDLEELQTALRAAVDTWEDGHETGYEGIRHGLRDAGNGEPKVWTERERGPFSGGRTGTPESGRGPCVPEPGDPMATGRHLMKSLWKHADGPTLVNHQGAFMSWVGPHWGEISDSALRSRLYQYLEHAVYELPGPGKDGAVRTAPWRPSRERIRNLREALAAISYIPEATKTPSWFSGQGAGQGVGQGGEGEEAQVVRVGQGGQGGGERVPQGTIIACTNGLLDVSSRRLLPLTPRYFNRVSVPFAYDPAAPAPERWFAFLKSVWGQDQECVQALQEWFGYVISGRTDLQKILYVVGPKRAGKGTIESTITALIGEANRAPFTCASLATDFGLATLVGKSLAVDPDVRQVREGSEMVLARLLSISGEDPVSVKRKYKDDWTGKIPARLMLMSNNLPTFKDPSGAITSRLVILTMANSFLGREDVNLKADIAKELPGILNWSMEGLDRLERRGRFTEPGSSEAARTLTEASVSSVKDFVEEECLCGDAVRVGKAELHRAYRDWAEARGSGALSLVNFAKELYESVGAVPARPWIDGKRAQVFAGVRLLTPMEKQLAQQCGFTLTTLTSSPAGSIESAGQSGRSGWNGGNAS